MSDAESALPRWLIVVRRDRRDLFEQLRQAFASDGRVQVIVDRRRAERPPAKAGQPGPRRRRPLPSRELALWEHAGFSVIHTEEGYTVYEAEEAPGAEAAPRHPAASPSGPRDREIRRHLEAALRLLGESS